MDAFISCVLVAGGSFSFIAGLGLLRLPDVLVRMHATTKAGTLGVGLVVLGIAMHFGAGYDATRAVLIIGFMLLTAPVSAHLIGRAAYRTGTPLWKKTLIDDHPQHRCEPSSTLREQALEHGDRPIV